MTPAIATLSHFLVAIPAPPSDSIGPFRLYGLMIALGVLAAVTLAQRRWSSWGGDEDAVVTIAIWAVPAGLIGARLYHVITDWNSLYSDGRWADAFKIWNGGLGIPGGVLLGALVGILVARRMVPSWRRLGDAVAPAIPLAQAIGRLGNYFNQELYGRATELPWALQVDAVVIQRDHPGEFAAGTTFHPTFLYEALWNLALAGLIIWGGRKLVLKPGRWFALYIAGYGLGRLWVESLRIDPATVLMGMRVNIWMSLVIIAGGLLWFIWGGGPVDRERTELLKAGADPAELFATETSFDALEPGAAGRDDAIHPGEDSANPAEADPDDADPDDADPDEVVEDGADSDRDDSDGRDSDGRDPDDADSGSTGGSADAVGESGPQPD